MKIRLTADDLAIISKVMRSDNVFYINKGRKDWLFNQVNRFCREIAYPLLQEKKGKGPAPPKNKKEIIEVAISDIPFEDSTTLQILRDFANMKQTDVGNIIMLYIIHARLISMEQIRAGKIRMAAEEAENFSANKSHE